MSLEKFPIIGQNNAICQGGLPQAKTSPQLKKLSGEVSGVAKTLIARLGELNNDETLTPDQVGGELRSMYKQIEELSGKALRAVLKPYKNAVCRAVFQLWETFMDETNFATNLINFAKKVRKGKVDPEALSETQWAEVMQLAGRSSYGMSPEVLAHAIEQYLLSLREQADVGQSFYFGELERGFQGLLALPGPVRLQIDQLIWDAAGGEPIDPTLREAQELIAAAVMHSIEMRMGIAS